ncbi:MAG: hypothetical protein PHX37_00395 [Eubacteriales bacterium]|nr:hypothetical protein [Eubacteriales bacterium]
MLKRIGAWLLLLLFVLLMINIMFIGWQEVLSGALYIVIFIAYALFALRKSTNETIDKNEKMKESMGNIYSDTYSEDSVKIKDEEESKK